MVLYWFPLNWIPLFPYDILWEYLAGLGLSELNIIAVLVAGLIGAIPGSISLYNQHREKKLNLDIYAPVMPRTDLDISENIILPISVWCSDYAVCLDGVFLSHSKWIRIINKSSVAVVIYKISISDESGYLLEASAATTKNPIDFGDYRFQKSRMGCEISFADSIMNEDDDEDNEILEECYSDHESEILSDIPFPLSLAPYDAVEGYVFFRGIHDGLLSPNKSYVLTCYTARGNVCIQSNICYDEGDI